MWKASSPKAGHRWRHKSRHWVVFIKRASMQEVFGKGFSATRTRTFPFIHSFITCQGVLHYEKIYMLFGDLAISYEIWGTSYLTPFVSVELFVHSFVLYIFIQKLSLGLTLAAWRPTNGQADNERTAVDVLQFCICVYRWHTIFIYYSFSCKIVP